MLRILLFFISIFLTSENLIAQDNEPIQKEADTLKAPAKYGLRIGFDLAKPIRSLLDEEYNGLEIAADLNTERLYVAAEFGNEQRDYFEPNLNAITKGSYLKIGGDFNANRNWIGLNNIINIGLRYGLSTFDQELLAYSLYSIDQTFPTTFRTTPQEFNGLTASWLELIVGLKTEVLTNMYVSLNFQLKHKVSEDVPENFTNLFIPGFGKTNDFSQFGVGYSYSISYLIPLFKN
jgi:hypothetical protein